MEILFQQQSGGHQLGSVIIEPVPTRRLESQPQGSGLRIQPQQTDRIGVLKLVEATKDSVTAFASKLFPRISNALGDQFDHRQLLPHAWLAFILGGISPKLS